MPDCSCVDVGQPYILRHELGYSHRPFTHLLRRILNLMCQLLQQLAAPSSARLVFLLPPPLLSIVSAAGTARQDDPAACSTPGL